LTQNQKCRGGIIIIPAGFFFSPRDLDVKCRNDFMSVYKIIKVKYFEETVFDDTTTTIVVIQFELNEVELIQQDVKWVLLPLGEERIFNMSKENDWIIGGEIYNLPTQKNIKISRHVEGNILKPGEQQTFITLNALDSGTMTGRISLSYKKDYVYPAKDCSRTYATLRITGRNLTEEEQKKMIDNKYIFEKIPPTIQQTKNQVFTEFIADVIIKAINNNIDITKYITKDKPFVYELKEGETAELKPKSVKVGDKAEIDESLCVGCGICQNRCPLGAIEIVNLPA
jgi:NAD-dependent dihydropyrimidine dehydrogenase PreA subunit